MGWLNIRRRGLHPKRSTRSPKHSTLNPKPNTLPVPPVAAVWSLGGFGDATRTQVERPHLS